MKSVWITGVLSAFLSASTAWAQDPIPNQSTPPQTNQLNILKGQSPSPKVPNACYPPKSKPKPLIG